MEWFHTRYTFVINYKHLHQRKEGKISVKKLTPTCDYGIQVREYQRNLNGIRKASFLSFRPFLDSMFTIKTCIVTCYIARNRTLTIYDHGNLQYLQINCPLLSNDQYIYFRQCTSMSDIYFPIAIILRSVRSDSVTRV